MAVAKENMYIYNLPHLEFKACCDILDNKDLWQQLSVHMGYSRNTIEEVEREICYGKSPSEKLLNLWANLNHTVLELFILLHRMKSYETMNILKKFISPNTLLKFQLIDGQKSEGENVQEVQEIAEKSEKLLNIAKSIRQNKNESKPLLELGMSSLALQVGNSWGDMKLPIPTIPYEDLKQATDNWDSSTILGKGGFGTVFKGTWKCTEVAIKRIEKKEGNPDNHIEQMKQSLTELYCLNSYRHDNILPLYGFSMGGPQPCLVSQFMRGGSLEVRLRHLKTRLKWSTRLDIVVGTARGLQFLHTIGEKPLVHGDIKPANILLDLNDFPRIGDFGLAREGPPEEYVRISKVHGTRPYLPDEFIKWKKFSTKVDTYSFGIVLFEIASGLTAYSSRRSLKFLRDHIIEYEGNILDLKDSRESGGENCFRGMIDIGKVCVSDRANDRPEMVEVLKYLENLMKNYEES